MHLPSDLTQSGNKLRSFFRILLQFVLPILALVFVVYKISDIPVWQRSLWASSLTWNFSTILMVLWLIALSGLNWIFEAIKWKILVRRIEEIRFARAWGGVLYGVGLGMLTLRHPGEFIGRVLVLKDQNKLQGMILNTVCSFSQFFVTLLFGTIGLAFAISSRPIALNNSFETQLILFAVACLIVASGLVLNLRKILRWILAKPWFPQKMRFFETLISISPAELGLQLFLSLLRYVIFALQFYLLANLFGLTIPFLDATVVLSIIYLAMLGLPVSGLADAGVKSSVALIIFDMYFGHTLSFYPALDLTIFTITLSLWFINLALPGLAGAVISISGSLKPSQSAAL